MQKSCLSSPFATYAIYLVWTYLTFLNVTRRYHACHVIRWFGKRVRLDSMPITFIMRIHYLSVVCISTTVISDSLIEGILAINNVVWYVSPNLFICIPSTVISSTCSIQFYSLKNSFQVRTKFTFTESGKKKTG